jgi:hypothetical protein
MSSVYLELFHGRHSPDEELDDWGFEGPVFGPLPFVQVTYNSHVRLGDGIHMFGWNNNLTFLSIDAGGFTTFGRAYYGDIVIISAVDVKNVSIARPTSLYKRVIETQRVLQTDPALLINEDSEWVKLYIEWRFKDDTNPGKPGLAA